MKIQNLTLYKSFTNLVIAGTMLALSTTGCGNKQLVDLNKNFNAVAEVNGDCVSVLGIEKYSDYSGSQVQFVTNDGLVVLTSTHQTQLLNVESGNELKKYALSLAAFEEENINDYDEMQGLTFEANNLGWRNKTLVDLQFVFDKAIILQDDIATIVELETWKDYEADDKIQLRIVNGPDVLTSIDNVKLINDDNASENSLKNYAISLVGSEEKVSYYNSKNLTK